MGDVSEWIVAQSKARRMGVARLHGRVAQRLRCNSRCDLTRRLRGRSCRHRASRRPRCSPTCRNLPEESHTARRVRSVHACATARRAPLHALSPHRGRARGRSSSDARRPAASRRSDHAPASSGAHLRRRARVSGCCACCTVSRERVRSATAAPRSVQADVLGDATIDRSAGRLRWRCVADARVVCDVASPSRPGPPSRSRHAWPGSVRRCATLSWASAITAGAAGVLSREGDPRSVGDRTDRAPCRRVGKNARDPTKRDDVDSLSRPARPYASQRLPLNTAARPCLSLRSVCSLLGEAPAPKHELKVGASRGLR